MPRDGANQYHRPAGTDAVTAYTIESTKYNAYTADVEQDLNLPRPIVAGGTGANNARDAMTSLQGDVAYQVVTNYDAYAFVSGSFYSDNTLGRAAPVDGHAFIGQCYTSDPAVVPPAVPAGQNMFIEARDVTTGLKYLRQKTAGVWGAWAQQAGSTAALDAAYVNVTGDTMTGNLTVGIGGTIANSGAVVLNGGSASGGGGYFGFQKNSVNQWLIGSQSVILSNASNDFTFYSAGLGASALNINYSTGALTSGGTITAGGAAATGSYYFGNSGTKSLTYDGTNFQLVGGNLNCQYLYAAGQVTSALTAAAGTFLFGTSGSKYLNYDGTNFNLAGGPLFVAGNVAAYTGPNIGAYYFGSASTKALSFDGTRFNFAGGNVWHGTPNAQVDAPMAAGVTASGAWPAGISGQDRGILFLHFQASNLVAYFTQGSTGNAVGSITTTTVATVYNTASSAELKEDLKSFDAGNIIDATNVYDFAWKKTGERSYGVIAQQAIDIYPMAVTHTEVQVPDGEVNDFWGVDYSKYVPVLLQELKALRTRVAQLEGRATAQPA